VATAVSLAVALVLRDRIELLVSLVSFGALTGFALLHVSVLMHFKRHAQRRLFAHVVSPALGIAVVAVLIWCMQPAALAVGSCWLVAGLFYGALLHLRRRAALKV
jgi:amino acid transporter